MRLRVLFVFISLLYHSGLAFAVEPQCDVHGFLKSALYEKTESQYTQHHEFDTKNPVLRNARSAWGKVAETGEAMGNFKQLSYFHSTKPLMTVYHESLAEKTPELIRVLDDVNRFQVSPEAFANQFKREFKAEPTYFEYHDFYRSRDALFKEGMKEYITHLRTSENRLLANKIEASIASQADERKLVLDNLLHSKSPRDIAHFAREMNTLMAGSLTELYTGASLPYVKNVGSYIGEMHELKRTLEDKINNAIRRANGEPEVLNQMIQRYPRIHHNPLIQRRPPGNLKKRFELIADWIKDKEVDIVREHGGKTRWVEVKRNAIQFDMTSFTTKNHKGKSPLDQILENKEIIEFLGLSDKIQIEYLATGGMTDEVKALLESRGIRVISTH